MERVALRRDHVVYRQRADLLIFTLPLEALKSDCRN